MVGRAPIHDDGRSPASDAHLARIVLEDGMEFRLIDGKNPFTKLPEDTKEGKPKLRLPDGESPFKKLDDDKRVPAQKPRLKDGTSAFEKLPPAP